MRRERKHFSNVRGNPQVICKFTGKRGYHNLGDILNAPFYGKVEVVDARANQTLGELTYPELRKKYIG